MTESAKHPYDKVIVSVAGRDYEGWLQSTIETSLETISGRFSIPVSLVPGNPPAIRRQDTVKVRVNDTVLITGYVLACEPFYRRDEVGLRIEGRDRTGDLVACSAIYKGGQWRGATLRKVASDLVRAYGIEVVMETDDVPLDDVQIEHGETVLAVLSRIARHAGVLVTRDNGGCLVLTTTGHTKAPGPIVRGQNVISMESIGSDAERFSEYIAYGQSNVAAVPDFDDAKQLKAHAVDPDVKRSLPLIINAEGNATQDELQRLVEHTMRVRRGHSYGLRYELDGWTWQGTPWQTNQLVPVYDDIAGLSGDEWLICEVKLRCDRKEGAIAEVTVRPPEAYDTAPLKARKDKGKKHGKKGKDGAPLQIIDVAPRF